MEFLKKSSYLVSIVRASDDAMKITTARTTGLLNIMLALHCTVESTLAFRAEVDTNYNGVAIVI